MTKQEFIATLAKLYRVGNASDSDNRETWTHPNMAGGACCRLLDEMTRKLEDCGVLSAEERQALYDTL